MTWYYADGGRQIGPIEDPALDDLVRAGVVRDDTLVWREGLPNWQPHSIARGVRPPPIGLNGPPSAAAAGSGYCSECGRPFPLTELVSIGGASVCAQCKPIYLQRVQEGGRAIGAWHYGGFWMRFVAKVIDGVILGIAGSIIDIPLALALGFGSMGIRPGMPLAMLIQAQGGLVLINLAIGVAYEVYFVSTRAATPGKMILGLKIVRSDGSAVSAGVALARYFAEWISAITLMIGYIMAGFDGQKRALHDHICDTRVIYARELH